MPTPGSRKVVVGLHRVSATAVAVRILRKRRWNSAPSWKAPLLDKERLKSLFAHLCEFALDLFGCGLSQGTPRGSRPDVASRPGLDASPSGASVEGTGAVFARERVAERGRKGLGACPEHLADAVREPSKPAGTDSQLISTLADFGRAQCAVGQFCRCVATLKEAIRRAEDRTASDPHIAKSARQLYWSHIALGDVFGSPGRFNLGRPKDAAEHYQKARKIAEKLVAADPGNEMAKLDLARAFSREGMTLVGADPAKGVGVARPVELTQPANV